MPIPIEQFEMMQDYAHRDQLAQYQDGRAWVFLHNPALRTLGQVASYFYNGNKEQIEHLIAIKAISVFKTLAEVPGNDFIVIYFEDAYFLKTYTRNTA